MSTTAKKSKKLAGEVPADVLALEKKLAIYLPQADIDNVRKAYLIGADAHKDQKRKTGEPYITHPIAVASILAEKGLDAGAIIAAILHDTIEDTHLSHADIEAEFGLEVADLVEGVTKLDRIKFRNRQEATAESFRKLMLAMTRDLRVIMIKLADRLHNMRTLDAMDTEARKRIARETLEIYAQIAQRLGMNRMKAELQDLGFAALYPLRHRAIQKHLKQLYGSRREGVGKIQTILASKLVDSGIPCRLVSRLKSPYSIYRKMRSERKTLAQLSDVYGVRVVVQDVMQCYMALGAIHSLYKPKDGKFKDYIAIPKSNGYQSLHTVLLGPGNTPLEVQIRTEDMDSLAERGIAAHWAYKADGSVEGVNAKSRATEWLIGLVNSQRDAGSSQEFVENVKIDLFPDEVYVFTPKGAILALPRNATALDFAYAVHTDLGNHAVAARVDERLVPLRTKLASGHSVNIITAASAVPNPSWLSYVVSAKARTAIRHHLKSLQHEDAVELGHRMLDKALDELHASMESISSKVLNKYLSDHRMRRLEDLLSDIALGNRMPMAVAKQLLSQSPGNVAEGQRVSEKILITGNERGVISYAACCHPIPGDDIMGYLSAGKGVVVHRQECANVSELLKNSERCMDIGWDREVRGEYKVGLRVVAENRPGVLATMAATIADCQSNIENVEYQERDEQASTLVFVIEVRNRKHLADVMRKVRSTQVAHAVFRHN